MSEIRNIADIADSYDKENPIPIEEQNLYIEVVPNPYNDYNMDNWDSGILKKIMIIIKLPTGREDKDPNIHLAKFEKILKANKKGRDSTIL